MNLEDIARKAQVSKSTVSRVVNGDPHVSSKTRQRVMAVIQQEQFTPNPAARALVTRRSNIIGVTIPQTVNVFFGDNSYFPMLLQGIAESANKHNHAMLLWLAESNEARSTFSQRVVRHREPDGLIITSILDGDPLFEYLIQHKRRFVMVETPPAYAEQISYVSVDNVGAAKDAVRHLVDIGRRRIAHIMGDMLIQDAIDRMRGYREAMQDYGLLDESLIVPGKFNAEIGYESMKRLLTLRPDAVFCAGDTIAAGAIRAIQDAGMRVPDDIAIVGFDDLDVATSLRPQITTIRHSVQQVGFTAAQLLIDILDERVEHPHQIMLPTALIVRGSTVS
jgi:LacI family transcriptional regulator